MLAPNTLLQNRYLIVRSIGHGGMGAVYLARDERLGNTVALKETFFTDERLRKAFEREARLLAHLRHPALPKVTDHFDEDGGQFIVMEFISGDDLEILLAQRGQAFPVEQVLAWGDELLKALDYLHKQDPPILHRDIKPANLKLTPEGEIILLDFGLAKGTAGQTSSVMTSKSIFGFTPNFAPLEQIQGTGTGPRSDLYSLAATLYYLMTRVIPPDALTRITEVANGQPDPLRRPDEVNPQIPQAVANLLMKTMAHNRDHRPASAGEMRRMLREVSPPLASFVAFEEKADSNHAGSGLEDKQTILPSTLIEPLSTQETPAAVETSPSALSPTAGSPVSKLETAPIQETNPVSSVERKSLRLPWAIAGFVVLLLIGVTIGLVSNYNSDKAAADQASKVAAKDASSTGVPTDVTTEQAPVGSEKGENPKSVQVTEQKALPPVKAPVKVPSRRTSTGSRPAGSKTSPLNPVTPNQSGALNVTQQNKDTQQTINNVKKGRTDQPRAVNKVP
ncbi:MAG: eukaryotic-like serine/threonine-protein kinase [Acidobacteriota bacterium]|jgi:serine/threonine protein kinase|nr:eukaryotic-like serine/threonine-protein kinase [Acidobacteriota bacterium]